MLSRWVKDISLTTPSLDNNTADADRLCQALQKETGIDHLSIDFELLNGLPDHLRKWNYQARCLLFQDRGNSQVIGIGAIDDPTPLLGVAVDLGTTRVVLRLLDLSTGKALGETTFDNPQITIGPDVLTRIHAAEVSKGLDYLSRLIRTGIAHELAVLCTQLGYTPERIYLMTLAGNTAMTHLFLGLDPRWIIREPYIPVVNRPGVLKARQLGFHLAPTARVFVFPNIGSYFGGDLIAGILFSELHRRETTAILVDVGTNAEVVLGNKNWLIACAGAAGPALEGGVTCMGMTAGPGAIDRIRIDPKTFEMDIHTIDDAPPVGICGSGVIDLAAQLFLSGLIDIRGKLLPDACPKRIRYQNEMAHLVVVSAKRSATGQALCISQADLDSLIRSKAAMYTILETLTATVGMTPRELDTFYVAGTFGSYIDPVSAITIGMIPDLPLTRYQSIGNSSLGGACRLLTDPSCMVEIDNIRERITYLELNVNQEFMNRFSAAKFIPHTTPELFPTVRRTG
mgnify:CR=1 FL=1